ncbi:MAG: hypothetical protein L0Z62_32940 [Gemmataceae bacterium]|nr:hypothetical protein [Gemmataceae bacterium]
MLAVFCLRLTAGLLACLLLLPTAEVNPRFFRTHFLTALGLTALAMLFLHDSAEPWLWLALVAGALLAFAGSVVWHLEGAPGGRALILLAVPVAVAALLLAGEATRGQTTGWLIVDDLTSAALLGAATTAMLVGHSYLLAPAMSIRPLMRLLGALAACTLVRMAVAGTSLWSWTDRPGGGSLETELVLWLPVRWLLGFVGPLGLGWMAWETAKIRSTQSATGILYVVVILCFLGELTSQLLLTRTGYTL